MSGLGVVPGAFFYEARASMRQSAGGEAGLVSLFHTSSAGAAPEGFEAGAGVLGGVGFAASIVGVELGDGVVQAIDRAANRTGVVVDAVAGLPLVVAHDRLEVADVAEMARASSAVALVDGSCETIGVGLLQDAAGYLDGAGFGCHVLHFPNALVEALLLEIDQIRQGTGEPLDVDGVAGSEAIALSDGVVEGAAGDEVKLIGAAEAPVGEHHAELAPLRAEGAGAVVDVEDVDVPADAVAGDDFVL